MATFHRPKNFHLNLRRYITRRVLVVVAFSAVGYGLDLWLHMHYAGKGGELLAGAVLGHFLLEVEG